MCADFASCPGRKQGEIPAKYSIRIVLREKFLKAYDQKSHIERSPLAQSEHGTKDIFHRRSQNSVDVQATVYRELTMSEWITWTVNFDCEADVSLDPGARQRTAGNDSLKEVRSTQFMGQS